MSVLTGFFCFSWKGEQQTKQTKPSEQIANNQKSIHELMKRKSYNFVQNTFGTTYLE